MFGSDYSSYPEIIIDSFSKMKEEYRKKTEKKSGKKVLRFFISQYIRLFGIPEIGFQIRYLHFNKIISENIKKYPHTILDAGSGIGNYTFFLHKKYPKALVTGIDIDVDKLTFLKAFMKTHPIKNTAFHYMNLAKKKVLSNKYDFIVSVDVLEHIKNYKQVLRNFARLLKPNGYLYIHTPHENQKRIFSFSKKWHHHDHVREGFAADNLKKDIQKEGLVIVKQYLTFGPFGRFAWEVHHGFLENNFIVAGLVYPVLYAISCLDLFVTDSNGWGIALLARKPSNKPYVKK